MRSIPVTLWVVSFVAQAAPPADGALFDGEPQVTYSQKAEPPPATGCRQPTRKMAVNQPPPLSRPANPWQAVKDGQPVPLPITLASATSAHVFAREEITQCDAVHDHCFRDCSWLVEWYGKEPLDNDKQAPMQVAAVASLRPDGYFVTAPTAGPGYPTLNGADDDFIAYRSVPAVKRLLKPGVKVAVPDWFQDEPIVLPRDEVRALASWRTGVVRKVDFDKGVLFIKRSTKEWPLSAVRVLVLKYPKGGKVELMEGLSKDEIVVKPDELFLPKAD